MDPVTLALAKTYTDVKSDVAIRNFSRVQVLNARSGVSVLGASIVESVEVANQALHCVYTFTPAAHASYLDTNPKTKLTDGNLSTAYADSVAWRWDNVNPIVVDIDVTMPTSTRSIARARLYSLGNADYRPTSLEVFTSINGSDWASQGSVASAGLGWWEVPFAAPVAASFLRFRVTKNDCSDTRCFMFVHEVEVYSSTASVVPYTVTQIHTDPIYYFSTDSWGEYVYGGRWSPGAKIDKIDKATGEIVAQSGAIANGVCSIKVIPERGEVMMGTNQGQLNTYALSDLSLSKTNVGGADLPEFPPVGGFHSFEDIMKDNQYVYVLEGYGPRLAVLNIADYSLKVPVINPIVAGAIFWCMHTDADTDFIAFGQGRDDYSAGGVYLMHKHDWTIRKLADTERSVRCILVTPSYIIAGTVGSTSSATDAVIHIYDYAGNLIKTITPPNECQRIGSVFVHGHTLYYVGATQWQKNHLYAVSMLDWSYAPCISAHATAVGLKGKGSYDKLHNYWCAGGNSNGYLARAQVDTPFVP